MRSDNIVGKVYSHLKKSFNSFDFISVGCSMSEYLSFFDDYFEQLSNDFDDPSVNSISVGQFNFSGSRLDILRTKYGVYDNGVCQDYSVVSSRFGKDITSIKNLERRFAMSVKKNYNEIVLNNIFEYHESLKRDELRKQGKVLIRHSSLYSIAHIFSSYGVETFFDLLSCNKNDLIDNFAFSKCQSDSIINYIHGLGLKFKDEIKDNSQFVEQNELLLSKDIRVISADHGYPKLVAVDIASLNLGIRTTKKLLDAGIKLVDDVLRINTSDLLEIVEKPSQFNKIVDKIHELGYKFADEADDNFDSKILDLSNSNEYSHLRYLTQRYKKELKLIEAKESQIRLLQTEIADLKNKVDKIKAEITEINKSNNFQKTK